MVNTKYFFVLLFLWTYLENKLLQNILQLMQMDLEVCIKYMHSSLRDSQLFYVEVTWGFKRYLEIRATGDSNSNLGL